MKTKKFLLSGILGIALAGFVLTGCNKDNPTGTTSSPDYTASEDDNNASTATTDSKNIANAAAQSNTSRYHFDHSIEAIYSINCNAKFDSSATTDSIIVSFGAAPYTTPVNCNDGRWRQGQIIIYWPKVNGQTLKQAYFNTGSVLTMTFKNYAVGAISSNMIGIAGSRSDTNKGLNNLNEENWNFHASLTLTYSSGQTATWTSNRNNTLVQIGGVYYYEITGNALGVSRTGVDYSLAISNSSPLYFVGQIWTNGTWGCMHFEAGTITMNTPGYTISIDYGSTPGNCPSTATLTVTNTATTASNTYTIDLL